MPNQTHNHSQSSKIHGSVIQGSIVWFISTVFVIYAFCLMTASAVFSHSIQTSFKASNLELYLASGAFVLGYALMQIPVGYLLDKFNARIVVGLGILILAVGNILISFTSNITSYTAFNFIQGIGASFAFVSSAVLISQWFSIKTFPILFGLTQTLACILAGIIHFLLTLSLEHYSWNVIYQGIAVFGLILLILSICFVKSPPGYKQYSSKQSSKQSSSNQFSSNSNSLGKSLMLVLKNKQIILCAIAAATSFGILLAYASIWYQDVQNFYSVDTKNAVLISSLIFCGIGLGAPLLGYISNLLHSRVMVIHITLVLGTMALLLSLYLPHFNIDSLIIAKIIAFLVGFLLSGSLLFYTMVGEISEDAIRGVAISVINAAVFIFNSLMLFIPLLFITEKSTQFFTYLWTLPFFIMFSILLLYFIKESYK